MTQRDVEGQVNLCRVRRLTLVVHYQVKEQQRNSTNTPAGECECSPLQERPCVLIISVNELNGCTQIEQGGPMTMGGCVCFALLG